MTDKKIVDLGCGTTKTPGAIGIDSIPLEGVDIVADIESGLPFFEDNSIDVIYSNHFFEHVQNFDFLIKEVFRVLKKDGRLYLRVPHFSNPYYYSDYTHKRFFGLYTFDYFSRNENQLHHKVPCFYTNIRFKVIKRRLVFKSDFLLRGFIKHRIFEPFFNISGYFQELYEEVFCYLIPCQEIYYEIIPEKEAHPL